MNWLTLEYIKAHSRIDFADDDDALELYGNAAEETVLTIIRRTLNNVKDLNKGEVPAKMYQAALMLTELGYTQRSPISITNIYAVDYGFDFLVKGLMRLDAASDIEAERNSLLDILASVREDFLFAFEDIENPTDEQMEAYRSVCSKTAATFIKYREVAIVTDKICQALRDKIAEIKAECDDVLKTV